MTADSPNWIVVSLDRYEGALVRYTTNLVGNLEVARDIVQNAFLKLCQQRRAQVEEQLPAWLFTVCRNQAVDHLRREHTRSANASASSNEAAQESPLVPLERKERVGFLLACMDTLPARQQEVLRLKFGEGMSYKEIASVIETSVSNVGVLIHTAIRRLRDRIEADVPAAQEGRRR